MKNKITSKKSAMKISLLGERALVLTSLAEVSLDIQRKIWWLAKQLVNENLIEIVPGMNNLTLIFDPLKHSTQHLIEVLHSHWDASYTTNITAAIAVNTIELAVNYGGEYGPDLPKVAAYHGLSEEDVVTIHSQPVYTVFFLGFMPGFAYLGGMDERIATPRKKEPRLEIPAGSIGIGGAQTGVYPSSSPGGWQLIGQTKIKLFDYTRENPALLMPGDRLKFKVQKIFYA